jgi:hypothetical protein
MQPEMGCARDVAPLLLYRGMFATHYHHLSEQHAHDPHVAVMHMACAVGGGMHEEPSSSPGRVGGQEGSRRTPVETVTAAATSQSKGVALGLAPTAPTESAGGLHAPSVEEVTFLYKLRAGEMSYILILIEGR